jgi:hypothetical protein
MAAVKSSDVKDYLKIGLYLGGAFLAYKAIKGLAETFGLIQTEAENTLDHTSDQASGDSSTLNSSPFIAFNGNYAAAIVKAYNKKYGAGKFNANFQLKFPPVAFLDLVHSIYNSKGTFNDNEEATFGVFRQIQTQYQLSLLSSLFYVYYKKDLLEYLKGFLNADEMLIITNIVKNYPQYFKQS